MVRPNALAFFLAAMVGCWALLVGCSKSDRPAVMPAEQPVNQPPVKPPIQIWEPDPTWLPQLIQTGDMGKYQVSLMKGFTPIEVPPNLPANMKLYIWQGVAEEGRASPVVTFTIYDDNKQMLKEAKQGMRKMLAAITSGTTAVAGITGARPRELETGSIGGLEFSRAKWSGQTKNGLKVEGISYAAIDDPNVLTIIATSSGKDAEQSSRMLESIIATLKKK
jgi:hypothetical protein